MSFTGVPNKIHGPFERKGFIPHIIRLTIKLSVDDPNYEKVSKRVKRYLLEVPPRKLSKYCELNENVARICAEDDFIQNYKIKHKDDITERAAKVFRNNRPPYGYLEKKQPQVSPSNRRLAMAWLSALANQLMLLDDALYMCYALFDLFLYLSPPVKRVNLQKIICACLNVAEKYTSGERARLTKPETYAHYSDGAFTAQEFVEELKNVEEILREVNIGAVVLPNRLLQDYLLQEEYTDPSQNDLYLYTAFYILEVSSTIYESLKYSPEILAKAALALSYEIQESRDPDISKIHFDRKVRKCAWRMKQWLKEDAITCKRTDSCYIHDKYETEEFFEASSVVSAYLNAIQLYKKKLETLKISTIPDIYDVIEMEHIPAEKYLEADPDNIIIIDSTHQDPKSWSSMGFTRQDLTKLTGMDVQNYFFECYMPNSGLSVPSDAVEIDPFVIIRSVANYYVFADEMRALLKSKSRIFVLERGRKLRHTANIDVIDRGKGRNFRGEAINVASKDHCQEGSDKMLYYIKIGVIGKP